MAPRRQPVCISRLRVAHLVSDGFRCIDGKVVEQAAPTDEQELLAPDRETRWRLEDGLERGLLAIRCVNKGLLKRPRLIFPATLDEPPGSTEQTV